MLAQVSVFWFSGDCFFAALSALRGAPTLWGPCPVICFGGLRLLLASVMLCFRALLIELTCCTGPQWAFIRCRDGSLGGAGGRHRAWFAVALPCWPPLSVALVAFAPGFSVFSGLSGSSGAVSRGLPWAPLVSSFRAAELSLIRRRCHDVVTSLSPCGAASALTPCCRVAVGARMVYSR